MSPSDLFPGLQTIGADTKAELGRLATKGADELASALFNGSSFVQYGNRQMSIGQEAIDNSGVAPPEVERGGMEI